MFIMVMLLLCISVTNVVFAGNKDGRGSGRHGSAERKLGEALFEDINLSLNRNQSCETCHSLSRVEVPTEVKPGVKMRKQPAKAFVDPANIMNGTAVSECSTRHTFTI
ncbi:MAG: cytochrome-c peroxidase [Candidatus Scalindua sp.]|nr:cytochrome-c peroxidase [Candidatus Scalindua sp.]MCR4345291.1 cytochrome-c peroxidase [Candidatus Scalindua sp.]